MVERLGKYELLECLGRGGMGEVWKARDTQLRRFVAIKVLHADLQANPDFVAHFMREAQLVASLRHPNIVQVHDFQLTDTQGSSIKAYMVMDYIEGGTLADAIANTIRKGRFPPAADIVTLFTAISLALDYAHQKGMIHRDIKPANILMDSSATTGSTLGEPILTDFGIAKLQNAGSSTVTRALIGTPRYISPEQAEGHAVDERSDLYSLGIVLYEIVTGMTPFRSESPLAIMMQHVHEKPNPPELLNPNITPALSAVVLQSIAKDPAARYPSASAMTMALSQAFGLPVPTSLNTFRSVDRQTGYNPLQPFTSPPGVAPRPVTTTTTPQAAFTPSAAAYPGAQSIPPSLPSAHVTPATTDQGQRALRPPVPSSGRGKRRNLTIAIVACVVDLLLGISAFAVFPQLFSRNTGQSTPTPNVTGVAVGQIVFVHSPNAAPAAFDQLRIDLKNIPPAPAGTIYYAWLVASGNDTVEPPHWPLQVANGSIHYLYPGTAQHTDLFMQSNLFLITTEDATSTPIVPFPVPNRHLYYATITHTSVASPTFGVRQCSQSGSSTQANPCN